MSVVLAHSSLFLAPLTNMPIAGKNISTILQYMTPMALLGVELFFVLSGFLIGNILIRLFINTDFAFSDLRNFWARRWFLTLPNYWLLLTINIILYKGLHLIKLSLPELSLYYPFLQNLWYPHPEYFFGEAWSLSIEEWFYLTLPFIVYLGALFFRPKDKRKFLLNVFLIYLLVFVLARFINAFHPINGPDQDAGIRKVVVFRLDSVMYGVLFAYFNYFRQSALARLRYYLLFICLTGTGILFYLISGTSNVVNTPAGSTIKFMSDAFLYFIIPLNFSLCLPYAYSVKKFRNLYFENTVRYISRISYSMYLIHFSLVLCPFFLLMKPHSPAITVLLYILYLLIVTVLSAALYHFFERPIMRLRDRVTSK